MDGPAAKPRAASAQQLHRRNGEAGKRDRGAEQPPELRPHAPLGLGDPVVQAALQLAEFPGQHGRRDGVGGERIADAGGYGPSQPVAGPGSLELLCQYVHNNPVAAPSPPCILDMGGLPAYMSRMVEVEIYSSMWCPFCHRAKRLLTGKGAAFTERDVDAEPALRGEMQRRSGGRRTVPQIFIGGAHVGGSDELAALERAGRLDAMLQGAAP